MMERLGILGMCISEGTKVRMGWYSNFVGIKNLEKLSQN